MFQIPNPFDYPFLVLGLSLSTLWISAQIGAKFRERHQLRESEGEHEDFTLLLGSTLTLLGLLIGFTFSMAVTRYDQRKNLEEEESNAIGTEFQRVDLLTTDDAAKAHELLRNYLDLRILNYKLRDGQQLQNNNVQTAQLQTEMWSVVASHGTANPTPVMALVLGGMNDVLNSQGYTQAAWQNRVPTSAWALLVMIAIFCNLLIGYSVHRKNGYRFLILPIALSISFFLIADIDSPRGGVIRIHPQNLQSLSESLHPR